MVGSILHPPLTPQCKGCLHPQPGCIESAVVYCLRLRVAETAVPRAKLKGFKILFSHHKHNCWHQRGH